MSTLAVLVQYASDLPDVEFFGKQDPYCVLEIGGQRQVTKTHKDGGKRPIWNEEVRFTNPAGDVLNITIMDKEKLGKDENIGFAAVSLAHIRNGGTQPVVAPVTSSRRSNGQIHLTLTWYGPPMGSGHAQQPPYGTMQAHHQQPGYPAQGPPMQQYAHQYGTAPQGYIQQYPGQPPLGQPAHGQPPYDPAQYAPAPGGYPPTAPGGYAAPAPGGYAAAAPGGYPPQHPGTPPAYGAQGYR